MQKSSKKAADTQVGGVHYKGMEYQPFHLSLDVKGSAGFVKAAKYLTRDKGDRLENLRKAYHCIKLEQEWRLERGLLRTSAVAYHRERLYQHYHIEEDLTKFAAQFKNGSVYRAILRSIWQKDFSKAKEQLTKFVRYGRWEEI